MRKVLLIATLVAVIVAAEKAAAYEFRFEGGSDACLLYPVNWRALAMYVGENRIDIRRTGVGLDRLRAKSDAISGTVSNESATVVVRRDGGNDRYCFQDGKLVAFGRDKGDVRDREARQIKASFSRKIDLDDRHDRIWRRPDRSQYAWNFWRNSGRLRLWFASPNEAGALLTLAALICVGLALRTRALRRVLFAGGALAFLAAVVATGSRGSVLAFGAGFTAMSICRFPAQMGNRKAVLSVILAFLSIAVAFLAVGRLRHVNGATMVKASDRIRIEMWTAVPKMMNAAPLGWWKHPGYCYCSWFQPVHQRKVVRHLLNTHFSVMVAGGYAISLVYLTSWIALLVGLFRTAWKTQRVTAVGQWVALGVAMCLSSVGLYNWEVWILPLATVLPFARNAFRSRRLLWRTLGCGAAASLVLLSAVFIWGRLAGREMSCPVRCVSGGVQVGVGPVKSAVVDDGWALSGDDAGVLGKELRQYMGCRGGAGSILLADSVDDIPPSVGNVVLAGCRCREYLDRLTSGRISRLPDRIWFISPDFSPAAVPETLVRENRVRLMIGQLAAEADGRYGQPPSWARTFPGVALYIPCWKDCIGL